MAKFYAVQVQDKALFEKLLAKINSMPGDVIPEELFTSVAKKKAAVLLKKEGDLF
jgi:type III secretion system FlhB-like substrate exporter